MESGNDTEDNRGPEDKEADNPRRRQGQKLTREERRKRERNRKSLNEVYSECPAICKIVRVLSHFSDNVAKLYE